MIFAELGLDFLLDEPAISADEFHVLVILRGMLEKRDFFLSRYFLLLLIFLVIRFLLIFTSRHGTHQQRWRVTVTEDLRVLLEIKFVIAADIDVFEKLFEEGQFGEGLVCQCVQLAEHLVELLEVHVTCPWVVPLRIKECVTLR